MLLAEQGCGADGRVRIDVGGILADLGRPDADIAAQVDATRRDRAAQRCIEVGRRRRDRQIARVGNGRDADNHGACDSENFQAAHDFILNGLAWCEHACGMPTKRTFASKR